MKMKAILFFSFNAYYQNFHFVKKVKLCDVYRRNRKDLLRIYNLINELESIILFGHIK